MWVDHDDLFEFKVDAEVIVATEDHPFWSVTPTEPGKVRRTGALGEQVGTAEVTP